MRRLSIIFILILSAAFPSSAQESAANSKGREPLATKQLVDVRLRGCNEASLLADFSLFHDIPIGFEVAMNGGESAELRMDLKKATLTEVLDRFVAEHPKYQWEIRDEVVNVFPKEGHRDPILQQILSTEIAHFSIKEKTAVLGFDTTLLETPELKPLVTSYGLTMPGWAFSGFYFPNLGRTFKLDLSNMKVRTILNNIVKGSPTAKFWLISRDSSDHTLLISLYATQEDAPGRGRRADFEDLEPALLP